MKLSIHVATEVPAPIDQKYLIALLSWHWTRAGHEVIFGPTDSIDADMGILHIDRTHIVADKVPVRPRLTPLLNERVLDISKKSYSTLRVMPDDDWSGPVIVKSDLNSFGIPERQNLRLSYWQRKQRKLSKKSWRLARCLPPARYPLLPHLANVPKWVWNHPGLIVERFMPERKGDEYCLRGWIFFGNHSYAYRLFANDYMVKAGHITGYEILDGHPAEFETLRAAHGFDFGKFDYVEVDGKPILLDMNKTPMIVNENNTPDTPRLRHLANGLYDFTGGD